LYKEAVSVMSNEISGLNALSHSWEGIVMFLSNVSAVLHEPSKNSSEETIHAVNRLIPFFK